MSNAAAHFTAVRDGHGGVTLSLRHRFRDQLATELDEDGIARSTTSTDENGTDPTEQIIHVFGPLQPGQTAELVEQDNGTIAVVLVTSPDELIGNTINSGGTSTAEIDTSLNNQGPRTRDAYIANSYRKGSSSSQLAEIQAANRAYYRR